MAKKVDPLKAKAAKQKKMAIGLSVLFVAVLALQGPKTLKMLNGPATVPDSVSSAALAPASSTSASGTVPAGTPGGPAPAAGAPAPAGEVQPAVLIDSDLPIAPGAGQLLSFEQFQAKDPFTQQINPDLVGGAAESSGEGAKTGEAAAGAGAASDKSSGAKAGSDPLGGESGGTVVPATDAGSGPQPGAGSGPAAAEPELPAPATTISVNGVLAELAADGTFPAAEPTFLVVSTAKDGTSVEIGIAGGVYAGGDETITLKLGKPLTLKNTADGSRYELELLTVQGFVAPTSKK